MESKVVLDKAREKGKVWKNAEERARKGKE